MHRDEAPPFAPRSEVQGVPCSRSNGGSSSTSTEARRPVLLVEMISKVESEVFAQWRNATKGFSHRKVILVSHGRRDKEILSWRITLSLVKSSVRRLVGGIRSASRQDRFDPPLLPPSARSRVTCQRWRSLSLSHFCKKIWSYNCFEMVLTEYAEYAEYAEYIEYAE